MKKYGDEVGECTFHIEPTGLLWRTTQLTGLCANQHTVMYVRTSYVYMYGKNTFMYHRAGNIGGQLYLVDWQISCHTANIKSANIA